MSVLGYLDSPSKAALAALGGVLVGLAGLLQYLTAPDLSFLLSSLVPVSLVAWCVDGLMYSVKYSGTNGIRHDVLGKSPATPREELLA